ncbi:MAG: hypothetical protein H7829_11190 [Magnetococcus sp. THC-1_WYH]
MTIAPIAITRIFHAPWMPHKPSAFDRQPLASQGGRIPLAWGLIAIILAITSTYFFTNQNHMTRFKELIQARTAAHQKWVAATQSMDALKEQLVQTSLIADSMRNKAEGSAKVISNFTQSSKQSTLQIAEERKQWQQEKMALERQIATLKETNAQQRATDDPNTQKNGENPAKIPTVRGVTENILLEKALRLSQNNQQSGCIEGDCTHGQGAWRFDNGDLYIGFWADSVKSGQGLYHYAHGAYYFGNWSEDLKHGYGVYQFANGVRYDGGWYQGDRYGLGAEMNPKGGVSLGQWNSGKRIN